MSLVDDLHAAWDSLTFEPTNREILESINQRLAAIVAQRGGASVDEMTGIVRPDYGFLASGVVGVPGGRGRVDFDRGAVTHQTRSSPVAEFRDLRDLPGDPSDLHAAAIFVDAPTTVEIGGADVTLDAGHHTITGVEFDHLSWESDAPVQVGVVGSLRADTLDVEQDGDLHRQANPNDTIDSWAAVRFGPPETDYFERDEYVPVSEADDVSVIAQNMAGSSDADVRLVAAREYGGEWFPIGFDSTSIPPGEHSVFALDETHRYLGVQVQNSTNGSNIALQIHLTGDV